MKRTLAILAVMMSSILLLEMINRTKQKSGQYTKRRWMYHLPLYSEHTKQSNKTIILIVAYLRSGSTLLASLFSRAPGTFYVFEPLHMLYKKAKQKRPILYVNGTARSFPDGKVSQNQYMISLESWMGCRFDEIDKDSLLDEFHLIYSNKSTQAFLFCVKRRRIPNRQPLNAIKECLPKLGLECIMANRRVFKTIRLSMKSAEYLLENYTNMKVIHLVRDPRGMFLSQMREEIGQDIENYIKTFCRRIAKDIEVSKRVLRFNRNNLMLVRYEDLAKDPLGEAKRLYKFSEVEFTKELKTYLDQSTSQNLKDGCSYCTTRGNSTETAFKWRQKITPPSIIHCEPTLWPGYERDWVYQN